ncbi:MAG: signal peptidase II [Candidatus Omnitrophica bacterium]|nr:signal peptidase II [Candidatus Omnitrophota bacterium]
MWLYFTGLAVFILDQLSKVLVLKSLSPEESLPLIPQVFHITLARNTGIAFGLLKGNSPWLFAAIAASILILFLVSLGVHKVSKLASVAYGLILGGAVSNFLDRILRGSIVDWLDFRIWPVFNIADACISVGAALFILILWRRKN